MMHEKVTRRTCEGGLQLRSSIGSWLDKQGACKCLASRGKLLCLACLFFTRSLSNVGSNPAPSTSSPRTVARITRLAIDNNHPPVPSSPHLLGTSSPWLQTTDSSAVWTQAPLDEEPSTAVRRTLRAPEGTGSRQ
ncbi:hypothetical protein MGG_16790 [Pyricularia oryzae 70-15]|uniref:Uncharacterized protein n=1 Tax=Pyricularia oryzae (strain 70-15 / ATCC MYA-4617 / FGSC 8958) TaxID=242507 RepID=G4N0Z1_PYRO7|nr:uncharacterized protein MGG_16790 [Pyricularia oryzae 70-15]EHA52369.1 hypothetical protein MGG_16790 [Pyricularia oryzae 70-15]